MLPFTNVVVTISTLAVVVDKYGDMTRTPAVVTTRTAPACIELDFTSDDRADPGRPKKRSTTGRLWLNPDDPITTADTIIYAGQTFEILGEPIVRTAPFGNLDHIVVSLSLIRG